MGDYDNWNGTDPDVSAKPKSDFFGKAVEVILGVILVSVVIAAAVGYFVYGTYLADLQVERVSKHTVALVRKWAAFDINGCDDVSVAVTDIRDYYKRRISNTSPKMFTEMTLNIRADGCGKRADYNEISCEVKYFVMISCEFLFDAEVEDAAEPFIGSNAAFGDASPAQPETTASDTLDAETNGGSPTDPDIRSGEASALESTGDIAEVW